MLSPRWRKVLRDLWNNKTRTLLVVLSIAVGVFALGMIAGVQDMLSRGLDATYQSLQPANIQIGLEPAFDDDLLQRLSEIPGVADTTGRRSVVVRFRNQTSEWRNLQLIALPDYEAIRINRIFPVSGAWPPPEQSLLIERASFDFAAAQPGESLIIEDTAGRERRMALAGVVHDMTAGPPVLSNVAVAFVSLETLEWLGAPRNYNELYVRVDGQPQSADEIRPVANLLRDFLEDSGRQLVYTVVLDPNRHPAASTVDPMLSLLGALGLLALLLSGFLVVNTTSAVLAQQVRQIGMMKAIGAQRGQLVQMYLGMVLFFGLLSLLIAVPLGVLGARAFAGFLASFLNFDLLDLQIPREVFALQIAVGVLVPMLAALYPVLAGTRVTVREAIGSYGVGSGRFGTNWIDRLVERIRGLSRPLLISLRNTVRRKGRLLLTLSTLTLSSAVFISILCVRASMTLAIDDALNFWGYDVYVEFTRPYRIEQIQREALSVPGVTFAESMFFGGARRARPDGTESDNIVMIAPNPQTDLINPTLLAGRWLLPEDENALVVNTDLLKNEPDLNVGSQVTLKINGRDTVWTIVGVVRGVLSGSVVHANYDYYSRVIGQVGRGTRVLVTTNQHDPLSQAAVAEALTNHFKSQGMPISAAQTVAEVRQSINFLFDVIIAFLVIMATLLAVVGGLGLMGTMSINVLERTREIGVLRAIGASNQAVMGIVLVEGLLISLFSWMFGTLLTLPISLLLGSIVGQVVFQAPLPFAFSLDGAIFWLLAMLILAAAASLLPAWNAARLSVRDVLSYE